ncbi:hypothetical protein VSX64_19660 [Aurantimonas sp. C2-6-R+9]|uniref:hypothetical protein n=1 Tax=unclassified Aurantimonas TaxID=2638230 RepID=UPI002E19B152|nr:MULTISPECIES: hypothetical protein [unclassified Aurantimonas]MEC5293059.1 hypothetical protein [Aurantimonas sp. C2-3-R2]MEC5383053.1 hypothetical protein [Aurantimonas sp. C2-6-R+9]MEC5414100.1 hypothetical protein [Aurantimonas sp. C2-4-R8]
MPISIRCFTTSLKQKTPRAKVDQSILAHGARMPSGGQGRYLSEKRISAPFNVNQPAFVFYMHIF